MKYLVFIICDDGLPAPEELAAMQRDLPGWAQEVKDRGVYLLGRYHAIEVRPFLSD
jgi:hypothetical protein